MKLAAYKPVGRNDLTDETLSNRLRHVGGRAKVRAAPSRFYSIAAITGSTFLMARAFPRRGGRLPIAPGACPELSVAFNDFNSLNFFNREIRCPGTSRPS